MGQRNFKKHFEFNSFSEIFYCSSTRLRNTNLGVFIKCQYTGTIFRNKEMGHNLLKKIKSLKFRWNILQWHDQTQEHKCFYIC